MLANLRKSTKWVVGIVIFTFIAMIVLEWGAQVSGLQRTPWAVRADGEDISFEQIDAVYSRAISGRSDSLDDTAQAKLYRDCVNEAIEQVLAMKEAERLGFVPTDQELYDETRSRYRDESGRVNEGAFERDRREGTAEHWRRVEKAIGDEIVYWKAMQSVVAPVAVTEEALRDFYDIRYQRVLVRHTLVRPSRYVSDEAARAFYAANPDSFYMEERARGRHILFPIPRGASDQVRLDARGRAEATLLKLRTGAAPFDKLFRDAEADTTGRITAETLEWFGRGRMVPTFDSVAFSHPVKTVTPIIETPYGYHIAIFDERQPRRRQSFDDVRTEIKSELVTEKEIELARAEAERLRAEIMGGADFAEIARKNSDGISAIRGGLLGHVTPGEINPALYDDELSLRFIAAEIGTRSGEVILVNPTISKLLFDLEKGAVSEVTPSTHGFHIVRVEDRLGGDESKWPIVRIQLERDYRNILRGQLFNDWKASLRKKADIKYSPHVAERIKKADG